MERLKLETIENIISVEKTTIEAFEKYGECVSLDKCILMGMEELKKYRIAEEQGLLLRLHFGIGDIVYEVSEDAEGNYYVVARKCRTNTLLCALNKRVGKTIFLAKEEAEQALAKMKEV